MTRTFIQTDEFSRLTNIQLCRVQVGSERQDLHLNTMGKVEV